jgi:hypothetical protein
MTGDNTALDFPRGRHRATTSASALLGVAIAIASATSWRPAARASPATNDVEVVVVTEDINISAPGCDAISAFDGRDGVTLFRGERHVSPGRLAAASDLSTIVATNSNNPYDPPFLYIVALDPGNPNRWGPSRVVTGADFTDLGGIAILPDGDNLLVALGDNDDDRLRGEYSVGRFRLSEAGAGSVGPQLGAFRLAGGAAEILLSPDGRTAHIVAAGNAGAVVHSIDAGSMAEIAAPIDLGPRPMAGLRFVHAALTRDGHYLAVNDWQRGTVTIIDLVRRTAAVAVTSPDVTVAGGIDFGVRGAEMLVALHAMDTLIVYRFEPPARLEERGRMPIRRPRISEDSVDTGPWPSVAWLRDGSGVVAATDAGDAEFALVDVSADGSRLSFIASLAACQGAPRNAPQDILTGRRVLRVRTPTTTSRATPTAVNTPDPAACVCAAARRKLPRAVLEDAIAQPERYYGWQLPLDPGKPAGPGNPRRQCLGMTNPNTPYHFLGNAPVWRVGCQ